MNTYKIAIEANIQVVALKDYTLKFVDIQADTPESAIEIAQATCNDSFIVTLVSLM